MYRLACKMFPFIFHLPLRKKGVEKALRLHPLEDVQHQDPIYLSFQQAASNIYNLLRMDRERERERERGPRIIRPSWSENCQQASPSH